MSSEEFVVSVRGLRKDYEIYENPRDRLKQMLFNPVRRVLGLEPRRYHKVFSALDDISFDVRKGETFGVIGRNGSGKSTLLQILCGTLSPSAGSVSVNGKVAALLELGAGFNPEFSGRENVYLNGRLFGLSSRQIDERFDKIAQFADIGDFIERPVKSYSSGMYVRLAFAVIAHVDADILIVDEALSVGDAYFVQKCMRFLREFMKNGTLLFVSHDTGAVLNLCSQALWLHKGKVVDAGEPKSLIKHYLEELVSEGQETGKAREFSGKKPVSVSKTDDYVDMREKMLSGSTLRNDMKVFQFNPEAQGFGAGAARILDVVLLDADTSQPLSFVVGGEDVILQISARANEDLESVILGFDLKDRLGQTVFGDNTYLTYVYEPQSVKAGQTVSAAFHFRMPVMPVGDYAVTVAVATGSQDSHVQQHWMHDALILKCQASRICFGVVAIPMREIEISIS